MAVGLGADFIGLNFYPPSPRCLTLEQAAVIARVAKGRARLVGVFVNAERAYIEERLESLELDLLQFHGDEDEDALKGWPVPVIRALRLRSDAVLDAIKIGIGERELVRVQIILEAGHRVLIRRPVLRQFRLLRSEIGVGEVEHHAGIGQPALEPVAPIL